MSSPVAAPESATTEESYLEIVAAACAECGAGAWQIRPLNAWWVQVGTPAARPPEQGWKLHLSAGLASAADVLRRAVPLLLAEGATFKFAASPGKLAALNSEGPLSQVGKFITVYPQDDAQAIRLAAALDMATRGLRGPMIPSDRPLAPGSLVHYRYGGFRDDLHVQTAGGLWVAALRAPTGALVPDWRTTTYRAPAWVDDPFVAAGVAATFPPPNPVVGGRYMIVKTIHRSPRGAVHLALDIAEPRGCVLKQARRDAQMRPDGRDARGRLRHEARVLAALAPDPRFPAPYGLVEEDGDLFLALEDFAGETLESQISALCRRGRHLTPAEIVARGRELAAIVGAIHAAGYLYGDLKSPNVIVAPDGSLRLLDFEHAFPLSGAAPLYGSGTRGYGSPQQQAEERPARTDDIHSLGALLFFLATGAEPAQAPHPAALLDRPLRDLNPALGDGVAAIIARCLDPDPARRYPTMAALDAALAALDTTAAVPVHPAPDIAESAERYGALARRLGATLHAAAHSAPDDDGPTWTSGHPVAAGAAARDLNVGSGGALLALAELVGAFDLPEWRATLAAGARRLARSASPDDQILPGLYVSEAGVGAALLRAGQVLGDGELIAAAAARGELVASLPHAMPDLFAGTAGRLRFHLLLWDETADPAHLLAALAAGDALLDTAEEVGDGELRWTIPPGYDTLSGQAFLGYAHGAAGIADALLDLHDAIGERCFLATATGAARWLARQAIPALDDGSGVGWPAVEGGPPSAAFWCHGAAGIGRFLLHLHRSAPGTLPGAGDLARRAGWAVARGTRWAGTTQCHGLAGGIEFLLDLHHELRDPAFLAEAQALARLLAAFASEQPGGLAWPGDTWGVHNPDFLVGYAGVAACLLRLAAPATRPHLLSRAGFRYRRVAAWATPVLPGRGGQR